jgi:hypothetical protein
MQIKVNGGIKVDIPDYNFVYNMLYDYNQGADALKRRSVGGENTDPSNKQYIVGMILLNDVDIQLQNLMLLMMQIMLFYVIDKNIVFVHGYLY